MARGALSSIDGRAPQNGLPIRGDRSPYKARYKNSGSTTLKGFYVQVRITSEVGLGQDVNATAYVEKL
ncbi:hypothetical protein [Streptomyces sp. NPDC059009]|uniref:hypothetical protein n=1 Tax=Streptomyces sp. NPDC059009 TaxID=3346694 RepID=UPI0036B1BC4F